MKNSRPMRYWDMLRWLSLLGAWALAVARGRTFLSLDDDSAVTDGYASQVAFILRTIDDGDNPLTIGPLYWIHALRASIAIFFQAVESIGGIGLVAGVMLLLAFPVIELFACSKRPLLGLVIPFLIGVLSYRSVLVALSIGYLVMLLLRPNASRAWLFLSFLFANLSSGAVLSALLISLLIGRRYDHGRALRLYMVCLAASIVISFADKYAGFVAGDPGYDSTVEGATGLAALLSRSTIFVSISSGDYIRALTYVALLAAALTAFANARRQRAYQGYALLFMATVPAFFLEGLGVISLIVPVLLFLSGVPLPLKRLAVARDAKT